MDCFNVSCQGKLVVGLEFTGKTRIFLFFIFLLHQRLKVVHKLHMSLQGRIVNSREITLTTILLKLIQILF